MDLSKTIIPKSDQLNADDLIAGPKNICIREIKAGNDDMQPVSIYFYGDDNKPFKPCKSVRRILVQLWGADSDNYINRKLTLYRDVSVKWAGVEVGGIRVSHASNISEPTKVLITTAKNSRRPFTIEPLVGKLLKDIDAAKDAVKEGKYPLEFFITNYDLTNEQLTQLQS